jgi:hypothetical protein
MSRSRPVAGCESVLKAFPQFVAHHGSIKTFLEDDWGEEKN